MGIFVTFSFKFFFFFFFFLKRKFIGHSSKNFHFSFSIFSIILKIQTYPNFINYDYWKVKYKRKCEYTRQIVFIHKKKRVDCVKLDGFMAPSGSSLDMLGQRIKRIQINDFKNFSIKHLKKPTLLILTFHFTIHHTSKVLFLPLHLK